MLTKEKIYNTINEVIISYKDSYDVIEKGEGNLQINSRKPNVLALG